MSGFSFELLWIPGIILLGIVMFVFATRQRRLTASERKASDAAARENWGKENVH
jgi:hypothetical protein